MMMVMIRDIYKGKTIGAIMIKKSGMTLPYIDVIETGININDLRMSAGLSVKDIQNVFGFSTPQAVYKWIMGDSIPSVDNLVVLAKVLGVTIDDIIACKCGE